MMVQKIAVMIVQAVEHPKVCVSIPLSEEEQKEMDELMKDYK